MSNIAIKVENLSKRYKIGVRRIRHDTLRDYLMHGVKSLFDRNGRSFTNNGQPSTAGRRANAIWALKDVSFDIKHGEVVGFVGRNGAGKSTLLKILSRITEPTRGRAEIYGRVGSLLEVGTGFHPELTGRENIYLNGAVLGMKKVEIQRKFDEIIDFAEIDGFVDTPVKRYSSGMYVRLAFAVAAHLEPEILIVDEVLAIGDVQFQKKCLGKMGNVAKEGRTVLFVTHNLAAVTELCPSSMLLRQGTLVANGPTKAVIDDYLSQLSSTASTLRDGVVKERSGDGRLRFTDVYLRDQSGNRIDNPSSGSQIDIALEFVSERDLSHVQFMLTLYSQAGIAVTHCNVDACGARPHVPRGRGQVVCRIPKLPLPYGRYRLVIAASDDMGIMDLIPTACLFDVETSRFFTRPFVPPAEYSTVLVEHSWQVTAEGGTL
ncbi:MAG: ABC transporter ATP-binding protein [Deltaproteobacteria bacterium]|nr:ABC transporter ATP-binding protein [Deltaproteobacteria bacterium]